MKTGDTLPEFNLPINGGGQLSDNDLKGKWTILYFYPKDMTPGCTTEALDFSEMSAEFEKLGASIVGVSKDSPARHDKFVEKHDLKVTLISDEEGKLCEAFDCWVEKKMYGKVYMGIERSTFLIDPHGKIREVWRNIKVKGHAEKVLEALKVEVN
jgi:peroxiredoxin Q/BCP